MKLLLSLLALASFTGWAAPTAAQQIAAVETYPTKPVKLIVPRPPGNANDLIARVLVQKLSEEMGSQFYVENLPAGGGIVGMGAAAGAPADGYTILAANQGLIVHPLVKAKVPYAAGLGARGDRGASSVPAKKLIALLKAKPGKYNYASPGH